jgi:hypothetical protein
MNASMARRIRCAEAFLIYAIDASSASNATGAKRLNPKPTRSDSR